MKISEKLDDVFSVIEGVSDCFVSLLRIKLSWVLVVVLVSCQQGPSAKDESESRPLIRSASGASDLEVLNSFGVTLCSLSREQFAMVSPLLKDSDGQNDGLASGGSPDVSDLPEGERQEVKRVASALLASVESQLPSCTESDVNESVAALGQARSGVRDAVHAQPEVSTLALTSQAVHGTFTMGEGSIVSYAWVNPRVNRIVVSNGSNSVVITKPGWGFGPFMFLIRSMARGI
jgi:hypothetical protein